MRVLTVVFATLFLMGCPENDSATDVEATDAVQATDVEVKVDAADAAGE